MNSPQEGSVNKEIALSLITASETSDLGPPYRCLPSGLNAEWVREKVKRLALLLDAKDSKIEHLEKENRQLNNDLMQSDAQIVEDRIKLEHLEAEIQRLKCEGELDGIIHGTPCCQYHRAEKAEKKLQRQKEMVERLEGALKDILITGQGNTSAYIILNMAKEALQSSGKDAT